MDGALQVSGAKAGNSVAVVDPNELCRDVLNGLSLMPQKLLSQVKAVDTGDFGKHVNDLIVVAKGMTPEAQGHGLLAKLGSMFGNSREQLLSHINSAEQQIDRLVTELDKTATLHRGRINDLEAMYNENVQYHGQLEAAVAKLQAASSALKPDLEAARSAADAFAAQRATDIQHQIDRLDKRVDDFQRSMLLSKQMAPEIRQMQDGARGLVETFDNIKVTTIPAFKSQCALYLINQEQKKGAALANNVMDVTEQAMRANADLLGQNAADIANLRNRAVVSNETLEYAQNKLIESFQKVAEIDAQGRQQRAASAQKLTQLEQDLVAKLSNH